MIAERTHPMAQPEAIAIDGAEGAIRPIESIAIVFGASGRAQPASGPVQSLFSLVAALERDIDVTLVAPASVRSGRFLDMPRDGWCQSGRTRYFWYDAPMDWGRKRQLFEHETGADLLLLNSFFDRDFTLPFLVMSRFQNLPYRTTILSPRGEFAPGALSIKPVRKKAYLAVARRFNLLSGVWLHGTEDHEMEDLRRMGLACRGLVQAPNARRWFERPASAVPDGPVGRDRPLSIAFLGRLAPVKNILFAIETMGRLKVPATLNLYGPVGDAAYWARCEKAIADLPGAVTVAHHGTVPNDEVPSRLASNDLFFLPTLGENFGHAINEALLSGVPALIADTTPWQGLEAAKAGWVLPLGDPALFADRIDAFAAMSPDERSQWRDGARTFAQSQFDASDAVGAQHRMFQEVLEAEQGAFAGGTP